MVLKGAWQMYHVAPSSLREQIQKEGLQGGKGGGFGSSSWETNVYHTTPLYLSVEPGKSHFIEYERRGTDVWQVSIEADELFADLPSLIDAGWEEDVAEGGMNRFGKWHPFDDLLRPGTFAVSIAIDDAGSAATFKTIHPDQLEIFR